MIAKTDPASRSPKDTSHPSGLFQTGVLTRGRMEEATVHSALAALKRGDVQAAVSHAWSARSQNPLRPAYFGLLIKAFEAAGSDDLAFKTLEHEVASQSVGAATYQKYLALLKDHKPETFQDAFWHALPHLKANDLSKTLALAQEAQVDCPGACWSDKTGIGLWVRPPSNHPTEVRLHWFGNDKWSEQVLRIEGKSTKQATVIKIPWRKGAEACTLRTGPDRQELPGSPIFDPRPLSPPPGTQVTDKATRQKPIEIIIPVYAGKDDTEACLTSVLAAKTDLPMSVTIITDRPPEAELPALIDRYRFEPNVTILKNAENLGFTATVNRGLRRAHAAGRDAILLNADTIVSDGWIDHLHRVAYAGPSIGTVTPLTNNGEFLSFPARRKDAPLPAGLSPAQVSAAATQANGDEVTDIPTGVGFCMFLKAACLREVGLLNSAQFGKGYGEEIDFCLRARRQGWRNVCATGLFVAHAASVSFGEEKTTLVRQNMPRVAKLYPEYRALMQRFLQKEPLKDAFHRLDRVLLSQRSPQPTDLVIAPSDWHASAHTKPLRRHFKAAGTEALWLSVDPNRPQKITLSSAQGAGAGALHYDSITQASDLIGDLERLNLRHIHWAHAPDQNIGMAALKPTLMSWPGTHHIHLLSPQIMAWASEMPAAMAVPYSAFAAHWAKDRGFETEPPPKLPPLSSPTTYPAAGPQTAPFGIAVGGDIAYGPEHQRLLDLARLTAAQELPIRYYVFEKTVNDLSLARTGHVVNLGGIDDRDRARMAEVLGFRYALDLFDGTDPSGLGLRQTAKMAPGVIAFGTGCREALLDHHPDAICLPQGTTNGDILDILKTRIAAR